MINEQPMTENVSDRIRIKRGQPWEGELGTCIGMENTLIGWRHKIRLDNGIEVLQTRGQFIVNPIEPKEVVQ